MKLLQSIIVSLGFAVIGLILGMIWAKQTGAASGQGLAGGAIVLGYGLIAAVIAMVIGLVTSLRLGAVALRRTTVIMVVAMVLFFTYAVIQYQSHKQAIQDPAEAYAGIPPFTVTLERTKLADPVLAKRITVNSQEKQWTTLLPDKRNCRGIASAAALQKAASAITEFVQETEGRLNCDGKVEQVFRWSLTLDKGVDSGLVELNDTCINSNPAIQFTVFAVQQVSMKSNTAVTCH